VSAALGFIPNTQLVQLVPTLGYNIYVSANATGAAKELDADPRSAIRSCAQVASSTVPATFLSGLTSFLQPWEDFEKENNLTEIPFSGFMTKQVEDYMVLQYQKQGFFNSTSLKISLDTNIDTYSVQWLSGSKSEPNFSV
jgi:hypothetical protein